MSDAVMDFTTPAPDGAVFCGADCVADDDSDAPMVFAMPMPTERNDDQPATPAELDTAADAVLSMLEEGTMSYEEATSHVDRMAYSVHRAEP
jgi:hypothetical protein